MVNVSEIHCHEPKSQGGVFYRGKLETHAMIDFHQGACHTTTHHIPTTLGMIIDWGGLLGAIIGWVYVLHLK